jgi:beta-galactosidase
MDKNDRTRSGLMTVFRDPKRGLMWYPSELKSEPSLHIEDPWQEGIETLTVYSNAEEVELILNGKAFMKEKPSKHEKYEGLDHPPFLFDITRFEPGELVARGLRGGEVVASQTVHTPETPQRIKLVMDTGGRDFVADGSDILVGYARVVDKNGTVVKDVPMDQGAPYQCSRCRLACHCDDAGHRGEGNAVPAGGRC